jgi:hypothetical protein
MKASIWIGFDPREAEAFAVARHSARRHCTLPAPIRGINLVSLQASNIYRRPTETVEAGSQIRMRDLVSATDAYDGAMSTEFAISRFLVPQLAKSGWALFMDCDVLVRSNLAELFRSLEPTKALYCVQHQYQPDVSTKMDGQPQAVYPRKNWSSVMVFNCDHPSNQNLTLETVNSVPGRDLHRFCWLEDGEIGSLDESWNWLPGHSDTSIDPKIVHFTMGGPWFAGYRDVPYAEEWRAVRNDWVDGVR